MRNSTCWGAALVVLVGLVGCGGNGGTKTPTDAGTDSGSTPVDAGHDSGMGPVDSGPPVDAGYDAGAAPSCDPYAAGSCPDGQKCSVVIGFDSTGTTVTDIAFNCVAAIMPRDQGVTCSRNADATPDDTTDMKITDNCRQGLFCWPDPVRGFPTCQQLCSEMADDCATSSYCAGLNNTPPFGICTPASGCDPVRQTGCDAGQGCYVVTGTNGDVLGACLDVALPDGGTGMPGEACMYSTDCRPGTQCFRDFYPDGGASMATSCHQICAAGPGGDAGVADGGAMDGGTPMDGGGVSGACTVSSQTCVSVPFGLDAGITVRVPTLPGSCQ